MRWLRGANKPVLGLMPTDSVPPPLPANLPQPTPEELSEGSEAISEAAAIAAGVDLSNREKINRFNHLRRSDVYENHLHKITVGGTYLVTGLCGVMLVVLVSQYILPTDMRVLSLAATERLQGFLFSGGVGGIVTTVWKRKIDPDR